MVLRILVMRVLTLSVAVLVMVVLMVVLVWVSADVLVPVVVVGGAGDVDDVNGDLVVWG